MNTRARLGNVALAAAAAVILLGAALLAARGQDGKGQHKKPAMTSAIAFVSTRHDPPPGESPLHGSQIYPMDADGTNVRRLTENAHMDNFPALSPDGTRIVLREQPAPRRGGALTPHACS